jgi:hypothetical protein
MLVEVKHLIFSLLSDSVRSPTRNKSRNEIEAEPEFVNLLWSPGIDFQPGGPVRQPYLTSRTARLHSFETVPGLLKVPSGQIGSA